MQAPPTFSPNPYANFDPSQWSNPYSLYQNQALPWPPTYAGVPHDAMGNPIASYQAPQAPAAAAPSPGGTTLNSSPLGNTQQGIYSMMGGGASGPQVQSQIQGLLGGQGGYGNSNQNQGAALAMLMGMNPGQMNGFQQQAQPAAAPQAAAPSAPNNWQAALSALANPGRVTTPGATVPQAAQGYQPGSNGVLQNFLANWQPPQKR